MIRLVTPLIIHVLAWASVAASEPIGSGLLPIKKAFAPTRTFEKDTFLEIKGTLIGTSNQNIAIRIDDDRSRNYSTRVNATRTISPGRFKASLHLDSATTEDGRPLNTQAIRQIIVFLPNKSASARIKKAELVRRPRQPVYRPSRFATGPLPIQHAMSDTLRFATTDALVLEGTVTGSTPATATLRIDDKTSTNYPTRTNLELTFQPGKFKKQFHLSKLFKTNRIPLDHRNIKQLILFSGSDQRRIRITRFQTVTTKPSANHQTALPTLPTGRLPLFVQNIAPGTFTPHDKLRITGTLGAPTPATIVVRIDDATSVNYQTRTNIERTFNPGRFIFDLPLASLRKSNGRPLQLATIKRIIVFTIDRRKLARASKFRLIRNPTGAAKTARRAPRPLGKGSLPIAIETNRPLSIHDDDELLIEGIVTDTTALSLNIRIDDGQSTNYATRYNDQRDIPPGPFTVTTSLKGLRTPRKRILDHTDIRKIIAFQYGSNAKVTIKRMVIRSAPRLPAGAQGYNLGPRNIPLMLGFEAIAPGDARVQGQNLRAVRRPRPDPLIATGISGIRRLILPTTPGRKRVTIWTEDPGEWETLPHPLRRSISVNGKTAMTIQQTPQQWIAKRYLRGQKVEHRASDDAWSAYGNRRGAPITLEVEATPDGIVIEPTDLGPGSTYIAAVLVEPLPTKQALEIVNSWRAEWYRSAFPVDQSPPMRQDGIPRFTLSEMPPDKEDKPALYATSARASAVRLRFALKAPAAITHPLIKVSTPRRADSLLHTRLWAGRKRLELSGTLLHLADSALTPNTSALPITSESYRGYEAWISIPRGTPPGRYTGEITITSRTNTHHLPIAIDVLPITLPPPGKPSGFYLAEPFHLDFFPSLRHQRDNQMRCDLTFLRSMGITGTAPYSPHFNDTTVTTFLAEAKRTLTHGVHPGWLVYNPLHPFLIKPDQFAASARTVAKLRTALARLDIPPLVWTIADEPSNPDSNPTDLRRFIEILRLFSPGIQLAGHLNGPNDHRLLDLFDVAIVNTGFGLDHATIAHATRNNRRVWIYNTAIPRLTAGLWLWSTKAERYVQWHARMPTADPFDPLDGRENDYHVLMPQDQICPSVPDIHRDLIEMADGIVDHQWLTWLDHRKDSQALRLKAKIKRKIGRNWKAAQANRDTLPAQIRSDIISYARTLK